MKDNVLLIMTALFCSGLAWAFWHFLGNDALSVLLSIALLSVTADNFRLRRKLRGK